MIDLLKRFYFWNQAQSY